MATIKGVWKFNEVVELINIVQDVNYSCGSKTDQTRVSVINNDSDGQRIMIQPAFSNVYYAVSGWENATNRIWDFGETDQEVSDDFAAWVFQNANGGKVSFPATDGNISVLVKENGTTTLATAGTYCESDIDVNVDVPDTPPVLQEKTATENGEVVADAGYDGLSKVIVDVDTYESVVDAIINRNITEIESNVTAIGEQAFYYCSKLTTADFPRVFTIGNGAFRYCTQLSTVNFPIANNILSYAFGNCAQLTMVDFPRASLIDKFTFFSCTALSTLILRNKTACRGNTDVLTNTPIASGTGYIYVPSALIEEYKVADNWSTYAAQFRALEDYTVDGTTTGELDPDKI